MLLATSEVHEQNTTLLAVSAGRQ